VLNDGNNGDVGEIDLDFVVPEKIAMVTARKQLSALSIPFEQRGQKLRVRLDCTYLDWTPGTGSLRFRGGTIFSSQGFSMLLRVLVWRGYR
jgi:hypothetical protein